MKYAIHRIVVTPAEAEGEPDTLTQTDTGEVFEELPAPSPTLGGRLLALRNETGEEHIAVEITDD